jgi:hypothetical protein
MMAGFVGSKGFPAPRFFVVFSGLLVMAGGPSMLLGFRPLWGVACIAGHPPAVGHGRGVTLTER